GGSAYRPEAPATGGPAILRLPSVGVGPAAAGRARRMSADRPRPVPPVVHPRIAGGGVWRATRAAFAGGVAPPVLVTTYRPDPSYPRVVAGLAWIDARRANFSLDAGMQEPPGGAGGSSDVPASRRGPLLATFNSGFKHKDGGGGYFARGRLFEPMQPGMATVVGTTDGRLDVRAWRGGSRPG